MVVLVVAFAGVWLCCLDCGWVCWCGLSLIVLVWTCLNRLSGVCVFCLTPTGIQCLAIALLLFRVGCCLDFNVVGCGL